ncbi:hypothetical protein B0H11DRAFT_2249379 [Mycena galericulata]|nr:hypothetical protein B0H11DRAFT_2249379 [Mycena galericulata]
MSLADPSVQTDIQPVKSDEAPVKVEEEENILPETESDAAASSLLEEVLESDDGSMPALTDSPRIWNGCTLTSSKIMTGEEREEWWSRINDWSMRL